MKRLLLFYITPFFFFSCEQDSITIGDYNQKALDVGRSSQNYDSAIYYATQNIAQNPTAGDHYFSYYIIAASYEKQRAYQKAAVNYVKSLQHLPEDAQHDELRYKLLYNIGLICKRFSNYELAISYYKQASNYVSENDKIWLYYNLGNAYKENGNIEEATYMYSESLKLALFAEKEIEQVKAYNQLGLLYTAKKDYAQARSQYLTIVNYDGNSSQEYKKYLGKALHNLGETYLLEDKYDEAKSYYQASLEVKKEAKNKFVTYFDLGKCHEAKGELLQAADYYQKASELFPATEHNTEFLKVHQRLEAVSYQLKQYEESHLAAGRHFKETNKFLTVKEQQLALFSSVNMQSAVDNVILTYRIIRQVKEHRYQFIAGGLVILCLLILLIRFIVKNTKLQRIKRKLEIKQQQVLDILSEGRS